MGLLDGVLGNVLGGLLGGGGQGSGQTHPLLKMALQLMQQHGGLTGILAKLRQAGLSKQVDSWVSSGENQPVSGEQVSQALGPGLINQLAGQTGLQPAQISEGLSQVLPDLVNQMTPAGQVPDDADNLVSQGLKALMSPGPDR